MKQCVLVIFIDSLMSTDFEILNELDNFKCIVSKGFSVKEVINSYPNLSSSVSTSILTGKLPYYHGIYFNDFDNVCVRRYRNKEYEDIKAPTILDVFKDNGYDVGLLSWPVTGYSGFKYNFSDIRSLKFRGLIRSILKGSPFYMLKNIHKYIAVLKIGIQPESDNFYSILSMELLENRKSNAIFMSLGNLGYVRRRYSLGSDKSFEALKNIDNKVGDIINWCDNKGIIQDLSMFIVSNGGSKMCEYSININYALFKGGFINLNKNKHIGNYIAYAHCDGGSAFIYLKRSCSNNDYGRVKVFLEDFVKQNSKFVKFVEETYDYKNFDLDSFSFRLESKINCVFDSSLDKDEVIDKVDLSLYSASSNINKFFHGYSGEKESNGVFIGYGNNIKEGICIDSCDIVDIAPTIVSSAGLNFNSSGKVIDVFKR